MSKKWIWALLTALVLAGGLTACRGQAGSQSDLPAEAQIFSMDTVMLLRAYGEEDQAALQDAEKELYRLENLLSRTREESEVSRLNNAGGLGIQLDPEAGTLLRRAEEYALATGGAFDITLAPVSSVWGFTEDTYRIPDSEELAELMAHVGMENLTLTEENDAAALSPGTQIDLGGIAKGYASDAVAAIFREHGIRMGTVSLGGNVWVCGTRPDGTAWRVGIQDPNRVEEADAYVGTLQLTGGFAVTSGGYQRYFEEDGKTYHHILDPATGYPAASGLASVTVVAGDGDGNGAMCDAFSTALFVMGEERALNFWRSGAYDFDLVLVTEDGRVLVTEGIEEAFLPMEGSGYVYETVS